jgi:hypothetical protein
MMLTRNAMAVSTTLRRNASLVRPSIYDAFERSVVGCSDEVLFFRQLVNELITTFTNLSTAVPGVRFHCRMAETHKKPIVQFVGGPCELADLLIVVKYHLVTGLIEKKSILYQVKMSDQGTTRCGIDARQRLLLSTWPSFSFGRKSNGGPQTYNLRPTTLEFGSYMLEPRDPSPAYRSNNGFRHAYGTAPTAHTIAAQSLRVQIKGLPYTRNDAQAMFSHFVFETGEHHWNSAVDDLVAALYRHVGLAPDPPDEFDGYFVDNGRPFFILEINATQGEGIAVDEYTGTKRRPIR